MGAGLHRCATAGCYDGHKICKDKKIDCAGVTCRLLTSNRFFARFVHSVYITFDVTAEHKQNSQLKKS